MKAPCDVTRIDQLEGQIRGGERALVERVEELLEDIVVVLGRIIEFRRGAGAAVDETSVIGKTAEQFNCVAEALPTDLASTRNDVRRCLASRTGNECLFTSVARAVSIFDGLMSSTR